MFVNALFEIIYLGSSLVGVNPFAKFPSAPAVTPYLYYLHRVDPIIVGLELLPALILYYAFQMGGTRRLELS
jgi:hypothetical protein